jgi:hypothetical protein
MGEQIWSSGSHNIRPRDPVHLLPVGRPLQLAQHTTQPDYCLPPSVQRNGRTFTLRLKDAVRACCATANWVDLLPWALLGLRAVAREDDGSTPAQAVFGSPLILPGQLQILQNYLQKFFLSNFLRHGVLANIFPLDTTPPPPAGRRCSCPMTLPAHRQCL